MPEPKIRVSRVVSGLLLAFNASCERTDDTASSSPIGGTVVIAATSDPDALFPPAVLSVEGRQATELIYEYLADVGPAMNTIGDSGFVKALASDWKWSADSLSISFAIHPRATWHDGRRVTSRDVVFTHAVYTDPDVASPVASSLGDIIGVTAPDSSTAVFSFARRGPRQFYTAAAQMLILPEHLLGAIPRDSLRRVTSSRDPTGSGKYAFASWRRGSHLELRAVEKHYRGRAFPDRVMWTISPEYQSAVARLLGGEADVFPTIRAETIPRLADAGFNLITLPGMDYAFMAFNLREPRSGRPHPLFGSRELRRAITMNLDRAAMVRNVFDSLAQVSIGPTVRAYPTTDASVPQLPYDTAAAGRLLDSLGWKRSGSDGMRSRNGMAMEFGLIVPVSSLSRMKMAVLIQEQLRRAGIGVRIDQMDYSAFVARQSARSFDAALAAWHLGSSPAAIRSTWTSSAAEQGGLNYGAYRNPLFDTTVDSALQAGSIETSRTMFTRANSIIVNDAPAVWLYEPLTLVAVHQRLRTTPMRPNAWWLDIGSWRIPPDQRIARDAAPNP